MSGVDETLLRFPILIGDIGGTNARFSIVLDANAEAGEPTIVQTANYNTIDEAIQAAVLDRFLGAPQFGCAGCGRRSTATRSNSPTAPGSSSRGRCSPVSA